MTSQLTILEESTQQTALKQDTMQESVTSKQTEAVWLNYNRIDKKTEIAKTLCARDYKGFGTGFDTMNGVVELIGSIKTI